MSSLKVEIKCEAKRLVDIDQLRDFQGNLKTLTEKKYHMLRSEILADGFSFPVFVWHHDGSDYILDGHQRHKTLIKLRKEGYEVPPVPVADILADTYKQAKKKLLAAASYYGEVDKQGFYEFISQADLDIDELTQHIDLPNVDWDQFKGEFYESPDFQPGSEDDQGKLDQKKPKYVKCPHCLGVFDANEAEETKIEA